MGSIADKLGYLAETKEAIRSAIEAKGAAVAPGDSFRSYAQRIGEIPQGGGGATEWIAFLEQVLQETETASPYRHIQLLTDVDDVTTITATNGNKGMVFYTSDGAVIPWKTGGISHTWDRSRDMAFDESFRCRWLICSLDGPDGYPFILNDALFSVVDKMQITNNSVYKIRRLLRGVKFINGAGWRSSLTSMSYALFNGCGSMTLMDGMDFQYVTATMSDNCFGDSLTTIRNLSGVKATLSLRNNLLLSHESLLTVLAGLADLSGQETKLLTLGAALLPKLSDQEKAIATAKNWTLD